MDKRIVLLSLLAFSMHQANAKTPSFQCLNMRPQTFFGGFISGDGSTVVHEYGVLWSEQTGVQALPCYQSGQDVRGISNDGTTILMNDNIYVTSYVWNRNSGQTDIPNMLWSNVLSNDGRTAGGVKVENYDWTAQLWSDKTGPIPLSDSSGQPARGGIFALSQDGSIAYGVHRTDSSLLEVYRWSQTTGMEFLSPFTGLRKTTGFDDIHVTDCSADGQFLTGQMRYHIQMETGQIKTYDESFRWSDTEGLTPLGFLDSSTSNRADAISADGSIIVGHSSSGGSILDVNAFIWDQEHGIRDLNKVLTEQYQVNLNGWRLSRAMDISSDGTRILAFGIGPSGEFDFCLVQIPEPAAVLLVGLGAGLIRIKRRTK